MPAALEAYAPLLPEIVLVLGALALLIYGVFRPDTDGEAAGIGWLALLVLAGAGWMVTQAAAPVALFSGAFIDDAFARFVKLLILAGAGGALVLCFDELKARSAFKLEFPILLLFATAGMFMMASAGDLIALYLGLELQSLALYVVAAIRRDDVKSSEAGLKYFVLGALSSGMLLYGASLLYGFAGTTTFSGIATAAAAAGAGQNMLLVFGLVFLLVGIAFKISAVPFHMWTPDVYEGAPTPVTAFLAAAPKVAAMALFVRVVGSALPGVKPQWQQIVIFLAVASMLVGAFGAIGQTSIKRLMAYSSIANMGYALVPLAAGGTEGVQGVLVYLAIYIVMTLGAFACILSMRRDSGPVETIDELAGLSQTNLGMAFALGIFMFSLAGIPPLAGFFAKWYAFLPAVKAGLYWLAVVGVVASVIGAYYYLRIVKLMFFDEAKAPFLPVRAKEGAVMAVAVLLIVVFGIPAIGSFLAAPLVEAAGIAAQSVR
ncbi:MAG: NADH-quinone oxidoreductase subunit NuoN [Hyphomicrobiaceae bacterium]